MGSMADIKRRPSGIYELRRRVPRELQAIIGKKEFRVSLRTADGGEAKLKRLEVERDIERAFKNAAAQVTLTHKDIVSLSAHWLRQQLAQREHNPPDDAGIDVMIDSHAAADEADRAADYMVDEVAALLEQEALPNICAASRRALAERMFWRSLDLWQALGRRSHGDYRPLASLDSAPPWSGPETPQVAPALTLSDLWGAWLTAKKRNPKTAYQWAHRWANLGAFLKHSDAARVTVADAWRWAEHLQTSSLDPTTINDGYLAVARAVYGVAVKRGRLKVNPFSRIALDVSRLEKARTKRQGFTADEARAFIVAARARGGWLHWVVLLSAYSGARLEEIAGAYAADVGTDAGVPYLDFVLDGAGGEVVPLHERYLKNTESIRRIPLHPAVIAEGFLDYARSLPKGSPLFPKIPPDTFGRRGGTATKHLARFLRDVVGIKDPRKVAAHSWRHTFVTLWRVQGMEEAARMAITGHVSTDVGAGYGHWPLATLAPLVARIPVQG